MKKLYLSKKDVKIFGVCGGIAESYDLDPTLVRLATVFACLVTAVAPIEPAKQEQELPRLSPSSASQQGSETSPDYSTQ